MERNRKDATLPLGPVLTTVRNLKAAIQPLVRALITVKNLRDVPLTETGTKTRDATQWHDQGHTMVSSQKGKGVIPPQNLDLTMEADPKVVPANQKTTAIE